MGYHLPMGWPASEPRDSSPAPRNRVRRWRRRILGILVGYLAASIAATFVFEHIRAPELLIENRLSMWRLRPGYAGASAVVEGPAAGRATVDGRGLRVVPGLGQRPEARRILAVGDSFTFGWDVDDDATYPAQLQGLLDEAAPGRYEVVNAGFPGCSSYQARQLFDAWTRDLSPHVLVALLGRNDERRAFLSDREAHRMLRWKPSPMRYVIPFNMFHYRFLQGYGRRSSRTPAPRVSAQEFEDNMRWLVEKARQRQMGVILITHWSPYAPQTEKIAREFDLPLVPGPELIRRAQKERGETLFIKAHHHPNRAGYSILAEALAKTLLATDRES